MNHATDAHLNRSQLTLGSFEARLDDRTTYELDRSDIAKVLALLASGELETGIDPVTGNEL